VPELYELRLAQLQRDGLLDDDAWGPEVKSGKRTGDGGVAPPADGGAHTAGGKGRSGSSRGGKNSKKKKPVPPWVTDTAQPGRTARGVPKGSSPDRRFGRGKASSKADRPNRGAPGASRQRSSGWGTEAGLEAHESYRHPFAGSRDNGISRRLRNHDPHRRLDPRKGRGSGVSDVRANDSRVNAAARTDKTPGIAKPGRGSGVGNGFQSGRGGDGYGTGRSGSGAGTGVPGNIKKRKRGGGTGGDQAGNPFESSVGKPNMRTPRPGNIRKSIFDYSPEQVEDSINVINKALGGILAEYGPGE
jgi:hypothetical protein